MSVHLRLARSTKQVPSHLGYCEPILPERKKKHFYNKLSSKSLHLFVCISHMISIQFLYIIQLFLFTTNKTETLNNMLKATQYGHLVKTKLLNYFHSLFIFAIDALLAYGSPGYAYILFPCLLFPHPMPSDVCSMSNLVLY